MIFQPQQIESLEKVPTNQAQVMKTQDLQLIIADCPVQPIEDGLQSLDPQFFKNFVSAPKRWDVKLG
jgi:hypothetical protein